MHIFGKQKRVMAETLLGLCPFLHVDSTSSEVKVPDFLRKEDLVLRIGRDPNVLGMPDLVIDDEGFSGTISVQARRHHVMVPWAHVHRFWCGDPFIGPMVVWPKVVEEQTSASAPPKLRVVKPVSG